MKTGLLYDQEFDGKEPDIISNNGNSVIVRYYRSQNMIRIPLHPTNELSYLTGIIIGDGTVHSPIKRCRGGYYWKISITGEEDYICMISGIISKLFSYEPRIVKDKRKSNCFQLSVNSAIIHRFFNRIIGIPHGKKRYTYIPEKFCKEPEVFAHFLAGILDSDGYVSKKYIAIIQKDKTFLERISETSERLLGIKFNGPYINRRIDGKIRGWWIIISKNSTKRKVLRTVPIKYKIRGP